MAVIPIKKKPVFKSNEWFLAQYKGSRCSASKSAYLKHKHINNYSVEITLENLKVLVRVHNSHKLCAVYSFKVSSPKEFEAWILNISNYILTARDA
jgi:hypothetical protein